MSTSCARLNTYGIRSLYPLRWGDWFYPRNPLNPLKGENPPALDHRKQRVDAPPLGGWEVR